MADGGWLHLVGEQPTPAPVPGAGEDGGLMSITEQLKKAIDDLRIDERVETLSQEGARVYTQTLESVGGYVSSREEDINALIDKVADSLDTRTEGRFAGEIGKMTGTAHRGVAKLADQGPARED